MGFLKKLFGQKRPHAITDDLLEMLERDEADRISVVLDEHGLWDAKRVEEHLAHQTAPDEVSHLTIDQKTWLAMAIDFQCPRLIAILPSRGVDSESVCQRVMMTSIGRCTADEMREKGFKAVHVENFDLRRYFNNAMLQHQRLLLSQDMQDIARKRRLQATIQALQHHYDSSLNEIQRGNIV